MSKNNFYIIISLLLVVSSTTNTIIASNKKSTIVSIKENMFYINGQPTYKGRTWNGNKVEGLLMNSRMVQGIFDDLHIWKNVLCLCINKTPAIFPSSNNPAPEFRVSPHQ